jgi:quinol monooxygenase YgiN
MNSYGCFVKFTTLPGQRDALVKHLLSAADLAKNAPGCELYIINTSPTEPETIWVTEIWKSQEEHDASLHIEGAQESIKQVLPLLAGSPKKSTYSQLAEKVLPRHNSASSFILSLEM